jgi:hypothetical protein
MRTKYRIRKLLKPFQNLDKTTPLFAGAERTRKPDLIFKYQQFNYVSGFRVLMYDHARSL